MTDPGPLPHGIKPIKNKSWTNWHQSVKVKKVAYQINLWNGDINTPSIPEYNATTAELQKLIALAEADGVELRGVGGTWSLTPAAATTGILINTQPLNYRFWPADPDLVPAWQGQGDRLVFAQCGMSISELNTGLHTRGRSLRTTGASNGQTIAGAIGTGTHGSAIAQGSISDSVLALHILTGDRSLWVERTAAPVASAAFLGALGATRLADDAVFDAALVGLGGMGFVHGVMLETVPKFWLQAYRTEYSNAAAAWAAIHQFDFATLQPRPGTQPYFFQALFNPYDPARNPHLTLMYDSVVNPGGTPPEHHNKWRVGDSATELVANFTESVGGTPPALGNLLMKALYPDVHGESGVWSDMFWDTSTRGRSFGMGIGIPQARAREAIDALYDLNPQFKIPGVFALRFVRPTRATLGFTRHYPVTCVVDIDGGVTKRMTDFADAAWRKLQALGIPITFHWGKLQPVDPVLLDTIYGAACDDWRQARKALLLRQSLGAVFSNQFLRDLRLATW